jgi:peptidyl-prolyl cis-trans isomerase D
MATLQKIRNQGGILVSIFVGVALLAFIVGDALSSSSQILNRSRNKVGVIAGETLGIQEYQALVNNDENVFKMMQNLPSLGDEQRQQVQDNTWQMEVFRVVMGQELEKIGLGVSEEEIYSRLVGDKLDPSIAQFISAMGVDPSDKAQLNGIIQQILQAPADNPYRATWQFLEKQAIASYQAAKYQALLAKALYIPGPQAAELLDLSTTTADISYLVKSYNTVSDSAVTVTPAEIKEYYNEHQHLFKQQESRQLTYVTFDVTASPEDVRETELAVEQLKPEFEAATDVIEFANSATEKKVEPRFYKKGELDEELDAFLFGADAAGKVHGPYLADNAYNLACVADRRMVPDSVRARQIVLPFDQASFETARQLADSLAGEIRGGASFDLLARRFSADPNSAVNGGDIGWFTQEMLPAAVRDTLFLARKNDVKIFPSQGGILLLQVSDRSRPVEKVLVGIVAKEINPSQQTVNKIYNEARLFVDNMETAAEFEKAVTDGGRAKRYATVGKNDNTIAGIDKARDVIREAYMTGSAGKVLVNNRKSPIFECGDKYVVAVLAAVKEEGVAPLQEVSATITRELTRRKKGEILVRELQAASAGSESLLSIARKAGVEVLDATDVTFTSFQVPGAGIEPLVIAEASRLEENRVSAPLAGNQGVFVLVVTSREVAPAPTPEDVARHAAGLSEMRAYQVQYQAIPSIIQAAKVEDLRYKFY